MEVTSELLSRYADGEATPAERSQVEEAVQTNPALRAELEEYQTLAALFGEIEPEPVGEEALRRLHAIRAVPALAGFRRIEVAETPRRSRLLRFGMLAAAAALLVAATLRLARPPAEVTLADVARIAVEPFGDVTSVSTVARWTLREGDTVESGPGERLSFRFPDGTEVVLLPGASLRLMDAEKARLFGLERGTALCTVPERGISRRFEAAGFVFEAQQATFGIRIEEPGARTMGPSASSGRRVFVAVSRGSVEVASDDVPVTVAAGERILVRSGGPWERSFAFEDSMYADLFRHVGPKGREILPGFLDTQPDVVPISRSAWRADGNRRVLVADPGTPAPVRHLVLEVRAPRETEVVAVRVRPTGEEGGTTAEAARLPIGRTGPEGAVLHIPIDAFDAPGTEREVRTIPASRGRLVRIELVSADGGIPLEVVASLWSGRKPAAAAGGVEAQR